MRLNKDFASVFVENHDLFFSHFARQTRVFFVSAHDQYYETRIAITILLTSRLKNQLRLLVSTSHARMMFGKRLEWHCYTLSVFFIFDFEV